MVYLTILDDGSFGIITEITNDERSAVLGGYLEIIKFDDGGYKYFVFDESNKSIWKIIK